MNTAEVFTMLMGAVAMASFVAALFFLRFWQQTRERLFLYFAAAFAVDAAARIALALSHAPAEQEPYFYIPRLVMFGLIIVAIIQKNRSGSSR